MMGSESREIFAGYKHVPIDSVMPCENFDDLDAMAAQLGGVSAMRRYIENPSTVYSSPLHEEVARRWLVLRVAEEREVEARASLTAATQAAEASRKAAFWTAIAAVFAAAGAIGTAVQAWGVMRLP